MFMPDVEYIGTSKSSETAPTSDDTFLAWSSGIFDAMVISEFAHVSSILWDAVFVQ